MTRAISLFTVDLAAACEAWRSRPLDAIALASPHGRVDNLLALAIVDKARPGAQAFSSAAPDAKRHAFDALVEDLAAAWLWDAPSEALGDALASLARLAGRSELELPQLEAAAPAYPPDLLDEPFVERSDASVGLRLWLSEPGVIGAAASALQQARDLPAGSFRAKDPALWRDLIDALGPLFAAARPGFSLLALRA